ncbi:hypothetical protein GCM10007857_90690 [Bradyrhizobium iriomotense]|uniref:Peptidase S9A N-terminal domain-containing protein n=1 Tax=Bradyrhizobium iriomotense TaxID=441950 RepID=A0ABQ6BF03_9BRAD|nr:hypothetical protein GCM10007857_90690 [Bradyrhizobium iriomotense]
MDNPRGLWRRTTLGQFRTPNRSWEILLDIDQLAVSEGKDWLLSATTSLPGNHSRTILSLSRGGSDAVTLRKFDTETKSLVRDGFVCQKGGAEWLDSDTLVLSSSYGMDMAIVSGYARAVRLWRRGVHVDQAPVIFETAVDRIRVRCNVDYTAALPRKWSIR